MPKQVRQFDTGANRDTEDGKYDYAGFFDPAVLDQFKHHIGRERDIAWAAGVFEGEGCITTRRATGRKTYADGRPNPLYEVKKPRLSMTMTDEDVVLRFRAIVGVGSVTGPYLKKIERYKPSWSWATNTDIDAMASAQMLMPYLGNRRLSRLHEVFTSASVAAMSGVDPDVLNAFSGYMMAASELPDGSKRSGSNWKKGIPLDSYVGSLIRHVMDLWRLHEGAEVVRPENGKPVPLEDALGGIMFNCQGYWSETLKAERG